MPVFTPPHRLDAQRWKYKRIGLFGGSFNPPHEGHVHVANAALHGLQLDFVWWLLTPQNPLKTQKPLSMDKRIALCRAITHDPKMIITGIESDLNTQNTYQSIVALKRHFPATQFVWISGMDSALNLHQWNDWQALLTEIPFLHLTRPPADSLVQGCPLKLNARQTHKTITKTGRYSLSPGHTYWMKNRKMIDQSSTRLRDKHQAK